MEWQHPLRENKSAGLKNMVLERRADSVLYHAEGCLSPSSQDADGLGDKIKLQIHTETE